jgi:GDP-L-fucose synthase
MRADLTVPDDCRRAVDGMDFVFMCAASTSGAAVITATPLTHVTPNVVMNAQVLDAAYTAGVKKLLFISSSAAYPPTDDRPVAEDEMFEGDPYDVYFGAGWMKRYAEVLCRTYATKISRPMPTVVVRPSNAYGPHDKFDFGTSHVTAALIRRVVERHRPLEVWGTGDDVRDLIYIDDLIDGMLCAFERDEPHLVVNLASGTGVSVREILRTLLELDDYGDAEVRFDPSKPRTIPVRLIDTGYAKRALGFEARVELREGLRRTVRWYRETRS